MVGFIEWSGQNYGGCHGDIVVGDTLFFDSQSFFYSKMMDKEKNSHFNLCQKR